MPLVLLRSGESFLVTQGGRPQSLYLKLKSKNRFFAVIFLNYLVNTPPDSTPNDFYCLKHFSPQLKWKWFRYNFYFAMEWMVVHHYKKDAILQLQNWRKITVPIIKPPNKLILSWSGFYSPGRCIWIKIHTWQKSISYYAFWNMTGSLSSSCLN